MALPTSALVLRIIALLEIVVAAVSILFAADFIIDGMRETARLVAAHESGSAGLGVGIGNLFAILLLYLGLTLLVSGIPSLVASLRFGHGRTRLGGATVGNALVICINCVTCLALSAMEPYAALYWLAFAAILSIVPGVCLILVHGAIAAVGAEDAE